MALLTVLHESPLVTAMTGRDEQLELIMGVAVTRVVTTEVVVSSFDVMDCDDDQVGSAGLADLSVICEGASFTFTSALRL